MLQVNAVDNKTRNFIAVSTNHRQMATLSGTDSNYGQWPCRLLKCIGHGANFSLVILVVGLFDKRRRQFILSLAIKILPSRNTN